MFQFAAFASRPYGFRSGYSLRSGFPHSDICGSKLVCQLPAAFRRLPRPSSPVIAKASTTCTSSLDPITLSTRGSLPSQRFRAARRAPRIQQSLAEPASESSTVCCCLRFAVLQCLRTFAIVFDCNHNPVLQSSLIDKTEYFLMLPNC